MSFATYIGLCVSSDIRCLQDKHVTIAYNDIDKSTGRLDMVKLATMANCMAVIDDIEYWEGADVTVAVLTSPNAVKAHKLCVESGYRYNYEFRPHVTLSPGDVSKDASLREELIGRHIQLGNPYIKIVGSK